MAVIVLHHQRLWCHRWIHCQANLVGKVVVLAGLVAEEETEALQESEVGGEPEALQERVGC